MNQMYCMLLSTACLSIRAGLTFRGARGILLERGPLPPPPPPQTAERHFKP
jgi:hypothetical protein